MSKPDATLAALAPAALRLKHRAADSPDVVAARYDLDSYARLVHGWESLPHHTEWVRLLTETDDDLLIIAPPGSAKTAWVGIAFCGWYLGRHPERHVIYCSNTARQTFKPSVAVRDTIAYSDAYHRIFPSVMPDQETGWAESDWYLKRVAVGDKDASFSATGVGGPILGARADLIVMDDICDQENTASHYMRQKVWDWVSTTLFSRRRDWPERTRTVCIMTRWHHEDVAAHLIELGFRVSLHPVIKDGVNIWPEIYSQEVLERARMSDPRRFQGMYMANPTPPEGSIWKSEFWRYYAELPSFSQVIQSWDTAFQEEGDYSVCTTWGVAEHGFYLLDVYRQRIEFPQLVAAVKQLYDQRHPSIVLVEDAASGQSLLQVLRQETRLPILAVKVDKSKETRAWGVVGLAQGGRVFLPERAVWLAEYESEMEEFPHGRHDDQCDSTAQALAYLRRFAGDRLTADSDVSEARPMPDKMGFGDEHDRPSLDFGRDSNPYSGYKPSRWKPIRR